MQEISRCIECFLKKTARGIVEHWKYQTHFDFSVSMRLVLIFKMSLTTGAGRLFNQVSAVILVKFFIHFIKADNSYLGKISEKLLDEIVLPLKA